jgi:hypothetical protein
MRASGKTSLNVLFIGNSFTARNDLPGMIARLASADGKQLHHRLISAGGASLRAHWNKGEAQQAICEGNYDYVVLQEQSTLPVKNAARMHESVRLFDDAIRSAGAKTVLYLTWARQHAPHTQQAITDAYTTIGREIGATIVPVGVIWQQVLRKHGDVALYDKDGSHPTLAGSYLAACAFFAILFRRNPAGWRPEGISAAQAQLLQRAAAALMGKASARETADAIHSSRRGQSAATRRSRRPP